LSLSLFIFVPSENCSLRIVLREQHVVEIKWSEEFETQEKEAVKIAKSWGLKKALRANNR
jgi:hypothetical protein